MVKISDEELSFITGSDDIETAKDMLLQGRTKCVIYTMGKDGSAVYTEKYSVFVKGYKVEAVDTTGAGDSFIGAFEYQLLRDVVSSLDDLTQQKLEEYLRFANSYAAFTTTRKGALSSLASKKEIEEWLKKPEFHPN